MSEGADPKTRRKRARPKAAPPAGDSPVPDSLAPPPAAALDRRGPRGLVSLALGAVVIFVAGVALWPVILPRLGADAPAGITVLDGADLDARFGGLGERLDALESAAAEAEAARTEIAGRLDSLARDGEAGEAALAEIAARVDAALAQAQALERRADELERAGDAFAALSERLSVLQTAVAEAAEIAERGPDGGAVAALARRLDRVESAAPAGDREAPPPAEIKALGERLDALEARLDVAPDVAAAVAALGDDAARLGDRLSAETARIAALEAAAAASDPGRVDLVLAIGRLRQALLGSGPYADDLALIAELGGGDGALAAPLRALAASAETGVPARGVLRARFAAVARDAVQAGRDAEAGDWFDQTVARLGRLVSVRRTGEVAGEGTGAVLARAEARLGTGDLGAAVAELGALEGAAADAAADWLGQARARLAAERALEDLAAAARG